MNRPLVSVAGAYAAGLLLGQVFQPPPVSLLAGAALVLIVVIFSPKLRPILLWPLLALIGWGNLVGHTAILSPNDLRTLIGNEPALVTVRGHLIETPRLKVTVREEQETWRNVARVRVSGLSHGDSFAPASGDLLVLTPGLPSNQFFAGQNVEIAGVIARPQTALAEGLFDFQNYLATRGIYFQLKAGSTNDWKLLAPVSPQPPLTDRFLNWSKQTLALGLPNEDEPLRLIWAMTLGWRTAFTGDIGEPYLRAGTMHLFAIDGLRIALLSGMIVALLRAVRLSRSWCGAVAVPAIWFYTAATGWEASAIRASVMMTIVLGGWALKRPGDLLNSLAAAAFLILVGNPCQLFEASFQLSFLVMLVIALMLPPLNDFFEQRLKPDELVPDKLIPQREKIFRRAARMVLRYSGLSFAAWIGSLPLSAKYFHLFSPVSTPANVLAVPLGTFALMANLGALVCGHWLPWFTELFNHAAWFFMVAMSWVSMAATKIPGAYLYVPEPSLTAIALFYVVIIAIFSGWFNSRRKILSGGAILFCIGASYLWQWQTSRDKTTLTILPLNGGHAIFVDADGKANDWLINCGNEKSVDFTLKDFLHAQGVNQISRLVLTDASARNCGGAARLDELFHVQELWTSDVKFRATSYRDAVAAFEKPAARHHRLHAGDHVGCWQVLFPAAGTNMAKADDEPLVLRGDFHGTKILLLSDLSRAGQDELLACTNDLRADLVIAGLPAEGEPLCNALLKAVQPRTIVIADAEFPATRRASRALRERLEQQKVPVVYTRTAGAVTVETDRVGWQWHATGGKNFSSR